MRLVDFIWPRMSRPYSLKVGGGRLFHATMLVTGSLGVVVELLFWHGRWDHLVSYIVLWCGAAVTGRIVRAALSRE